MWSTGGAYNAWTDYLERWGSGENADDSQLPVLAADDLPSDTWERLASRLSEALSRRLQQWSEALSRAVSATSDEFSVGRALSQARVGLRAMRRLADHPGLEPELRKELTGLVDEQIAAAQRMLEDQVDRMHRGGADARQVEARRRTIRENSFAAVTAEQPRTQASTDWLFDVGARPSRRVIVEEG